MINLSVDAINQRAPYVVENIRYYSSILMRKDHPKMIIVLSSFTKFFKEHNQN